MNKAPRRRLRTYSHNEDLLHMKSYKKQPFQDQNCLSNPFINNNKNQFSSKSKMLTDHFQIQPFQQIQNTLWGTYINTDQQQRKSFIMTKKAKIYPKTKNSFRQQKESQKMHAQYSQSNFEILKKQFQQLQTSQVLRINQQQKYLDQLRINPQIIKYQHNQYSQIIRSLRSDNTYFTVKDFNDVNKLAIKQKNRNNIKKVIKNKKFREYLNQIKIKNTKQNSNINQEGQISRLKQFDNISVNLYDETLQNNQDHKRNKRNEVNQNDVAQFNQYYANQFKYKNQQLSEYMKKRKQTPTIVKKYYRPQSCNGKMGDDDKNRKLIQRSNGRIKCNSMKDERDEETIQINEGHTKIERKQQKDREWKDGGKYSKNRKQRRCIMNIKREENVREKRRLKSMDDIELFVKCKNFKLQYNNGHKRKNAKYDKIFTKDDRYSQSFRYNINNQIDDKNNKQTQQLIICL